MSLNSELSHKQPRHRVKEKGLSERARQRLQGLSDALESSNTPQMFFPNVRSGKKTRSEITHDLMLKVRFLQKQIGAQIRERRQSRNMARAMAAP